MDSDSSTFLLRGKRCLDNHGLHEVACFVVDNSEERGLRERAVPGQCVQLGLLRHWLIQDMASSRLEENTRQREEHCRGRVRGGGGGEEREDGKFWEDVGSGGSLRVSEER